MAFIIPGDPFTEALGRSISGATESITQGFNRNLERKQLEQQEQERLPAYADFIINAMGLPEEGSTAKALRGAKSVDDLKFMGKSLFDREPQPRLQNQERRLEIDSMNKGYDRLTKDIQASLKLGVNRKDEKKAKESLDALRKEQALNENNIRQNKPLVNKAYNEYLDIAEQDPVAQEQEKPKKKIPFNPKNPEHKKNLDAALQAAGGDRQKANQLLSEIYE